MEDKTPMDELIDSLNKCFDGDGHFGYHGSDGNSAAQAYTTAVGNLGLTPEQFIDLAIGQARVIVTDQVVLKKSEQSVRDFVSGQLEE